LRRHVVHKINPFLCRKMFHCFPPLAISSAAPRRMGYATSPTP
jgi:hypothetical protein